jgi:hypothetical protein
MTRVLLGVALLGVLVLLPAVLRSMPLRPRSCNHAGDEQATTTSATITTTTRSDADWHENSSRERMRRLVTREHEASVWHPTPGPARARDRVKSAGWPTPPEHEHDRRDESDQATKRVREASDLDRAHCSPTDPSTSRPHSMLLLPDAGSPMSPIAASRSSARTCVVDRGLGRDRWSERHEGCGIRPWQVTLASWWDLLLAAIGAAVSLLLATMRFLTQPNRSRRLHAQTVSSSGHRSCAGTSAVGTMIMIMLGLLSVAAGVAGQCQQSYISTVAEMTFCFRPTNLLKDPNTGVLYSTCNAGPTAVVSIDGANGTILANSTQCKQVSKLTQDPTSGTLYISCFGGGVIAIRGSTISTVITMAQCVNPGGLFFDAASGVLFASCITGSAAVVALSGGTVSTVATSAQCTTPMGLFKDSVNGVLYVACYQSGIIAISGSTITTLVSFAQCTYPDSVFKDVNSGVLYATCHMSATAGVIAIDGTRITRLVTSDQCSTASSVSKDLNSGVVYASCASGTASSVVAISGTTVSTLVTSLVCTSSAGVLKDISSGSVLVACQTSGIFRVSGIVVTPLATTSAVCRSPLAVLKDDTSGITYASCASGSTAGIITISGTGTRTLVSGDVCTSPRSLVGDNNNGLIYAACFRGDSSVIAINGSSITPILPASACTNPAWMYRNIDTGMFYFICTNGPDTVVTLDASGTSTTLLTSSDCTITDGVGARGFFDVASRVLYVACDEGVFALDGASVRTILGPNLQVCDTPSSVHVDSGVVMVTCYHGPTATVIAIRGSTITPIVTQAQCQYPYSIIKDPTSDVYYVSCQFGAAVVVLRGSSVSTLATPSQCSAPRGIFLEESTGAVYAACASGGVIGVMVISQDFRCTHGSFWQAGQCISCAVGSYRRVSPESYQTLCQQCPLGTIAPSAGASTCQSCTPGKIGDESRLTCFDCQPGRYTNSSGQSSCELCPQATFASSGGSTSCQPCAANAIARPGSSYCSTCPPGTDYGVDSFGLPLCVACSAGRYEDGSGTSKAGCQPCPAGSRSAALSGSASCLSCSAGSAQPLPGQTGCSPCAPGRFALLPGSLTCDACSPGYYSLLPGSAFCLACPAGTASNATGLDAECPGCSAGFYQSAAGKTDCVACESHAFSERPYSTSCTRCSAQVTLNRTGCNTAACPPNYSYSDLSGCLVCPLGQNSIQGGECEVCRVNSYTPVEGHDCISCLEDGMEGLICSGGLASVKAGYWAYEVPLVDDPAAASSSGGVMKYQTSVCPYGYCPGSPLQQVTTSSGNASSNSSSSLMVQLCAPPRLNSRSNFFCGACEDGYLPWGSSCVSCASVNVGLAFGYLVLSFTLVVFFLLTGSSSAGAISVLLYFLQTAALEVGPVAQWLSWMQLVNFNANSTSACLAPWTPYQQMLFALLVPIILCAELAIIAGLHFLVYTCINQGRQKQQQEPSASGVDGSSGTTAPPSPPSASSVPLLSRAGQLLYQRASQFSLHGYIACALSLLLFCYTQVATTSLGYLYCVDAGPQRRVLFNAPTVDCESAEYRAYLVPAVVAIVLYVAAFPIVIVSVLWRHKDSLFLQSDSAIQSTSLTIRNALVRWSPLYRAYHPRAWFWTPLTLIRRVGFVLTSVWLVRSPAVRFMAFTFLNFASLLIHQMARPYEQRRLNQMEVATQALLVCISALLTGYQPPYTPAVQALIFLLIIPAAFVLVVVVTRQQLGKVQARFSQLDAPKVLPADGVELADLDGLSLNPVASFASSSLELQLVSADAVQSDQVQL